MTEPTPRPPANDPRSPDAAEPTWGAPQTASPGTWSTKKSLAAVGIAAVIAAAGGGVVYAATHSGGNEHGGPGGPGGPGMSWGGHNAAGPGAAAEAGLHGVFVISDGNGGFTTEITQTGTVTAVSDTSITAQSADNFSQTYTITDSTRRSAVKVGDTVRIQGTEANGTATATAITSGTHSGRSGGRGDGPGRADGMPGGPGFAPSSDGGPDRTDG